MGVVGVLVYSFVIMSGLMGDRIAPEKSYLLLALPCLVPAFWYLFGFLRHDGRDQGLIVSSVGWFLAALTLFLKHLAVGDALSRNMRLDQVPDSPLTWIAALAAIAAILTGAVLSGRYWVENNKTSA